MCSLFFWWLAAVAIRTDFEGGQLAAIERAAPDHYRLHIKGEVDQDGRNRQASWYYFCIDGARGRSLKIDLIDLPGEYNYKPNQGAIIEGTLPFISENGKSWRVLDTVEFDKQEPKLQIHITPSSDRIWIAHQPPYTTEDLRRLLATPGLEWRSIGATPGGRDIPLITIGKGPKVVWLLFRQHAWESGSSWAGEGAVRFLLSDAARPLREAVTFKILAMCDPDGVARGGVRFNAKGFDLNRNWDTADAALMPEITAQRKAILDWVDSGHPIDLLVTLHNDEQPEYLEGPPAKELEPLLRRFEAGLAKSPVFASTKPAALGAGVSAKGRMTVVEGLYHDRKIPAFLIELRIVSHPKLGRPPGVDDRLRFGADLVRAAANAVRQE